MEALVLVAHADDETLGCGGTIRKLVSKGWDVRVVILSNGVLDVRGRIEDNREDAAKACALLGVGVPVFLGFADQKFDQAPLAEMAVAVSRLGYTPDLILTHAATDLNLDHRLACDVAKIVGRPMAKPVSILGCEIPGTSAWNGAPFPANYFVDISSEFATKVAAFSQYANELQDFPHPCSAKGLRLLAEYHGMQCGFPQAEAFTVIRGYEGRLP
jgi:LmbE family N-acetylglucosaminyl deacetylase